MTENELRRLAEIAGVKVDVFDGNIWIKDGFREACFSSTEWTPSEYIEQAMMVVEAMLKMFDNFAVEYRKMEEAWLATFWTDNGEIESQFCEYGNTPAEAICNVALAAKEG